MVEWIKASSMVIEHFVDGNFIWFYAKYLHLSETEDRHEKISGSISLNIRMYPSRNGYDVEGLFKISDNLICFDDLDSHDGC